MEIPAHKAVLASISQFLFELFSEDKDHKGIESVVTYKLNGGFDKKALMLLIDYAYTAKLQVESHHVSFYSFIWTCSYFIQILLM